MLSDFFSDWLHETIIPKLLYIKDHSNYAQITIKQEDQLSNALVNLILDFFFRESVI